MISNYIIKKDGVEMFGVNVENTIETINCANDCIKKGYPNSVLFDRIFDGNFI